MWLKFKINKENTTKINLNIVKAMHFYKDVIHLCFDCYYSDYISIKREYNENFDEIVSKLMDL